MEVKQKSKLVAGLLGIFLGWIGIHNFYLGFKKKGIIQAICGGLGFILTVTVIASCIGGPLMLGIEIWGLIEGIFILTGKINCDADGNALAD